MGRALDPPSSFPPDAFFGIVPIAAMWPVDRRVVALMLPYFAWVGFATVLNASLAVLNA